MVKSARKHYITVSVMQAKLELAASPTAPLGALAELAQDGSDLIRLKVASNPRTPKTLLACMTKDKSAAVRSACQYKLAQR